MTRKDKLGKEILRLRKRKRSIWHLLSISYMHGIGHFPRIAFFNLHNKWLLLPYYIVYHTPIGEQSLNSSCTGEIIRWWRVWRKVWRRLTARVGPGTFRTVVGLVSEEKYPKANSTKGWLKWK